MEQVRFLHPNEYAQTKALAAECFGDTDDLSEYYENELPDHRVAVLERDGAFCSMVHLKRVLVEFDDRTVPAWYLLYVCTAENSRRRGYMDRVMRFVLDALTREGEEFTFLVPVDAAVYRHLGFTRAWQFNDEERDLLCADDGLRECYACLLNGGTFSPPRRILSADTVRDFHYRDFDADAAVKYFDFFSVRPNKSYDSVPLDCFIWSHVLHTECALPDGRCFLMLDRSGDAPVGCLPFCRENELAAYFKLQERYFNTVLGVPFRAYLADREGVERLKDAGMLDHYEVTEDTEIFDYIYDGDALRTLAGKRLSNKRNRINKFLREYGERWEYRTLSEKNRDEIAAFLRKWDDSKTVAGDGVCLGESYDAAETLAIELEGILRILDTPELLQKIRVGGIFIDGALAAFSMGSYNAAERMAVIEVEKADPGIDGLYQLINREFLVREFPQAELVNREDDVGLPGLRKAKMSYQPILFEKRFTLIQRNFHRTASKPE